MKINVVLCLRIQSLHSRPISGDGSTTRKCIRYCSPDDDQWPLSLEFFHSRDPRLNDESRAYLQFIRTGFGPVTDISIKGMRLRAEAMHRKMNENIIGTFKGQEVEKKIQISGNLGSGPRRSWKNER